MAVWPPGKYFQNRIWLSEAANAVIQLSQQTKDFQHCESGAFTGPYVNKSHYHNSLESVWKAAASELASAENIFVSGYSLPESDHFFGSLYALGTVGDLRLKKLWFSTRTAKSAEGSIHC